MHAHRVRRGPSLHQAEARSLASGVRARRSTAALLAALALCVPSCSESHEAPPGLSFRGRVLAAVHAGDSWYVGGEFTGVQTNPAASLVVLDASGFEADDCRVGAGFNGPVFAIAVTDDAAYVGGDFTEYRGQRIRSLAKLDARTCALDTRFSPPPGPPGFEGHVRELAVFGGALYVGRFPAFNEAMLTKLDLTTGESDAAFAAEVAAVTDDAGGVSTLAAAGTSLYVGGWFDLTTSDGGRVHNFARFDPATGALQTPRVLPVDGFDDGVSALAIAGDSIYVGGRFRTYRGEPTPNRNFARLDLDTGDIHTAFSLGVPESGSVTALAVSGEFLFVGGSFFGGSFPGLVKIGLEDGAPASTFRPALSAELTDRGVWSIAVREGVVYVVGSFETLDRAIHGFAALNEETGETVSTLTPPGHNLGGFDGDVWAVSATRERVWVGGSFYGYGGRRASSITRLDDTTFEVEGRFRGFDGPVHSLVVAEDALYVGGNFTAYGGVPDSAHGLAKLDLVTGELDTSFSPPGPRANGVDGNVYTLLVAGDSLLVGGDFIAYRGDPARTLVKVSRTTGERDLAFSPTDVPVGFGGAGRTVNALARSGNSLFVAGAFETYMGPSGVSSFRSGLVKLDIVSGELDALFAPATQSSPSSGFFGGSVRTLVATDTALYAGGDFFAYEGANVGHIVRLDLRSGALDTTFSPPDMAGIFWGVSSLAVADGALYAAGTFRWYRGVRTPAAGLARLDPTSGALDPSFASSARHLDVWTSFHLVVPDGDALLVGGDVGYYDGVEWVSRAFFVDAATGARL